MLILMLALTMAACNLPADAPVTEQTTPTSIFPTATPTLAVTLVPTETPLPTFTPTPTTPIAWPLDKGVNCRYGPSTDWVSIGSLLVGQTATIQGKNADASWWYVTTVNDPGTQCWVSALVTLTAGNLLNLPIIPPPSPLVTDLSIKLEPKNINIPGCIGPFEDIQIEGTIALNGPGKVKWYFETEQDGAMSTETKNFNFADSKKVEGSFNPNPAAGTFWVKLVVVEPISKTDETTYKIECPP